MKVTKNKKRYSFGKYQSYISDRMRRYPAFSRLISRIFGITTIGAYGRQLIFRELLQHVPMEKVKDILDLGCGGGEFSFMLADAHPLVRIDAIDVDGKVIRKVQDTIKRLGITNVNAFRGKIQDLASEKRYDLIFSIDVFEHIHAEEMPFEECYRRLKPGGYLIIKMPARNQRIIAPDGWFDKFNQWKDKEHVGQVYELRELVERFRKENFSVVTACYSDGLIARAGWELNYFMRKGGAVTHLLSLPLSKLLMQIDKMAGNKKKGNYIQVVGRKTETYSSVTVKV